MIDIKDLKVGDILIAKDECIMTTSGTPALIVGKGYSIESIDNRYGYSYITIESEYNVFERSKGNHSISHGFRFNELHKYFTTGSLPTLVGALTLEANPIASGVGG